MKIAAHDLDRPMRMDMMHATPQSVSQTIWAVVLISYGLVSLVVFIVGKM